FDRYDRLASEVLHELNLLLTERAYLLAEDDDHPDRLAFLEHRHSEDSAVAAELSPSDSDGIALLDIERLTRDVRALNHLSGPRCAGKRDFWTGPEQPAPNEVGER